MLVYVLIYVSLSFLMQDSCMHDELLTCDDVPQLDWMNSLLQKHDFEGPFFLSFCYCNSFIVFFINELQTMLGRNGWVLGKRWVWHEMSRDNVHSSKMSKAKLKKLLRWKWRLMNSCDLKWVFTTKKKKMVNTISFHIYKYVWTCIWLLDQLVKYI